MSKLTITNETTIFNRLKDPFSMYSILNLMNCIVMLVLYFVLPVFSVYSYDEALLTYYYWNGFYQDFDYTTGDLVATGINTNHPSAAHILILVGIILMIVLMVAQELVIIIGKNITKKKFLTIFLVPNLFFNSVMLFGLFTYVNWTSLRNNSVTKHQLGKPLIYILLVGIVVTLLIIGLATALTIIDKQKDKEKINS